MNFKRVEKLLISGILQGWNLLLKFIIPLKNFIPMLYKFDKKTLTYRKVSWTNGSYYILLLIVIFFMSFNISATVDKKITEHKVEDKIMIILAEQNKFTSEKLIAKIKEMHFQFPYIIYAQALIETDHFKSRIFLENNNLFGMKEASKRINVSKGSQYNHAFYNNWSDSLLDYGFYYATYLSKLSAQQFTITPT
jgi:hypothetical protein